MQRFQYNSQQGMVLIFTLCLLNVLAMINLYLLETNQLSKKIAKAFFQQHQIHIQSATIFSNITRENVKSCRMTTILYSDLKEYSKKWWQENACHRHYHSVESYYVSELLSETFHDKMVTSYWRITLLLSYQNSVREVLQRPYITIDNA